MAKTKMSWNWVEKYPVFIYTTFIDHGIFDVKVIKGVKNNQNAESNGPAAKAWFEYRSEGKISKADVVIDALRKARKLLKSSTQGEL